ncbi:conserved hypothetical protein [Planktothrix sp. PCC 11201]|uniref:hypothetical protein n=1 Tax=Planktothrix sp. PCC 11201 TaxID=1729650 RepID=UPI00091F87E2|nr:hypothetical protein [Planktothrix sp. PCC 11201]SKB13161.1 conserved hypothetical protein [Planktothrix sp. PCC 11201]
MLDIVFYPANGELSYSVDVSEEIYQWLAKSEFSKIGKSVLRKMEIDGETEKLFLVKLGKDTRKKFKNFFRDVITQESDQVLTQLGDSPSKQEYQQATYRLKILQELRKCIENQDYLYLQRC